MCICITIKNPIIVEKGDDFVNEVKNIKINSNFSKIPLLDDRFNIKNVIRKSVQKMKSRHPHIFLKNENIRYWYL